MLRLLSVTKFLCQLLLTYSAQENLTFFFLKNIGFQLKLRFNHRLLFFSMLLFSVLLSALFVIAASGRANNGCLDSLWRSNFFFKLLLRPQVKLLILLHVNFALRRPQGNLIVLVGNERVAVDVKPVDAIAWLKFQALSNEVFRVLAHLHALQRVVVFACLLQQGRRRTPLNREPSEQQLVEDHPDGPNVGFKVIGKALHDLRSHCQVAAQLRSRHLVSSQLFPEAQVHDLADALVKHHVLHLEISVHGAYFMQTLETVEDLLEVVDSHRLLQFSLPHQDFAQFEAAAVLEDDELVVGVCEIGEQADDVGVAALAQDGDLGLHQLGQLGHLLQLAQRRHLHRRLLMAHHVLPQVDVRPIPLPDQLHDPQVADGLPSEVHLLSSHKKSIIFLQQN